MGKALRKAVGGRGHSLPHGDWRVPVHGRVLGAILSKNAARVLAETGKQRFNAADYKGAIDALSDAEKYYQAPTILWLRALSHEKLGQLQEARAAYEKIDAQPLAPNAPKDFVDAKEAAKQSLESLKTRILTTLWAVPCTQSRCLRRSWLMTSLCPDMVPGRRQNDETPPPFS